MKAKVFVYVCLSIFLWACEGTPEQQNVEVAPTPRPIEPQLCTEPRPQICTMIYDPVCATREDGTQTTEASDCSACGNSSVVSYLPGECK
ncbi:hypothetical protein SAMN02745866_04037 [Alteromonadaceae bacterium Bs31]|nr:hypothetical protein SAMN02745866_04037 [Alteromonadaceae bacterium Bs31]